MADDRWEDIDPAVPVLLLPVRIETRSDGDTLRVRIYPDDVHVDAFDERMTESEIEAGRRYWLDRWPLAAPSETDPWATLVGAVGPRRAARIATALTPTNLPARPSEVPEFPDLPGGDPEHRPWARLLPDCFRVIVQQGPDRATEIGEPIDREGIVLGPRIDRPDGNGDAIDDELRRAVDMLRGEPGAESEPALEWMTNYPAAVAAGMAVTIALPRPDEPVDRLYVIGVRAAEDADSEALALADLLRAHAFSDGLGFVPVGTPTNNTESARSLWSRAAGAPGQPSASALSGPVDESNAEVMASALGIAPGALAGVDGAGGTDQHAAAAFATALWPVTWGAFLDKTLVPTAAGGAVPVTAREAVRKHAIAHVRGRGPLPPLRIGKQPYGVLPVTAHGVSWRPAQDDPVDAELGALLQRLRPLWQLAAQQVPTVTTGDIEKDLPRILGQLPVSGGLRVRTALTGDEAGGVIAPGLDAGDNAMQQAILTTALNQIIGAQPGSFVAPDMLAKPARILALPLAHETDPTACDALLSESPWPETLSVLQALLALADAAARHEWEQYLQRERLQQLIAWLYDATDVLDQDTIEFAVEALTRMGDRMWDELELYRDAAERIEDRTGPFDLKRYAARFASVVIRPHPVAGARTMRERVRVAAAALRTAQRYAEIRVALKTIGSVETVRERALLLAETLDCASHRLDAWLTSLATRRLAKCRSDRPTGLVIGAFGWLENIEIRPPAVDPDDPSLLRAPGDGGYVLAPSQAHAGTAAVLRGARLTHDPGDSGNAALDIDLSSTRVRAAMSIIGGMRTGQSLGALLGYRLERWLHEAPPGFHLDKYIYCLRSIAPLTAAKSTDRTTGAVPGALESVAASEVVDGVRLLELHRANPGLIVGLLNQPPAAYLGYFDGGPWNAPLVERQAVTKFIDQLNRLHDAVADVLLSESVHQLVLGAPARAAAAMDALSGDAIPPDPEVVRTPRSGVALTHRVLSLLPAEPPAASGWGGGHRSTVNPMLESWARNALGSADRVVLGRLPDGTGLTLKDSGLDALDVIAAAGPEDAEMAGAKRFWALLTRKITALAGAPFPGVNRPPGLAADALTFAEAWALAGSIRRLLVEARAVSAADLMRATDAGVGNLSGPAANTTPQTAPRLVDRADLRGRAGTAVNTLRLTAQSGGGPLRRADALSHFGIGSSVDAAQLPAEELAAHDSALVSAADARVKAAEAMLASYDNAPPASDSACLSALAEVVQTVFDDRQPFSPVLTANAGADPFLTALDSGVHIDADNRDVSDGRDIRPWLTRYARVRQAVGRFAETLLLREALGPRQTLRVAQLSGVQFGTWIGLRFPDGSGAPAAPVTGYVVDVPVAVAPGSSLCGFVVDEWSEVIPSRTEVRDPVTGEPTGETREHTTGGLAVNANGPNARAPQTLLLAMSPDGQAWSTDKVIDVLADTMESARQRAVALEQVPLVARMLPATYVQDWSLQGEPILDTRLLLEKSAVQTALLTHVAEKD
jgi:hypothetical protein